MKSELEIKEFIDSREAVTKNELSVFMYGIKSGYSNKSRLGSWWDYVIETKKLSDLVARKIKRELDGRKKTDFERFKELWKIDPRLKEMGKRSVEKLLRNVYGIRLSSSSIKRYRDLIK